MHVSYTQPIWVSLGTILRLQEVSLSKTSHPGVIVELNMGDLRYGIGYGL